jgi:hypothetical protein
MVKARRSRKFPGPKPGFKQDKDPGNEFLRSKLRSIAGNSDHTLAENPLGALFGRGIITERQREAGIAYAHLRASRFKGKHFPDVLNWAALVAPAIDGHAFPESSRDESPEHRADRIRTAYERADFILRQAGSRSHSMVQNVACFDRWPTVRPPASTGRIESADRDIDALKLGLSALAEHWKIRERGKEAA